MRAAVVSMPSMELFRAQPESYRAKVLGDVPRVAIEAGVAQCWYEWLGDSGRFVGLSDFGASAPAPKLYEHFGLTADAVAEAARQLSQEMSCGAWTSTSSSRSRGGRAGKRVLVRADLNVPVKDGKVTDATRLERFCRLKDLSARGARVVVISHFGRPKGGPDPR